MAWCLVKHRDNFVIFTEHYGEQSKEDEMGEVCSTDGDEKYIQKFSRRA
jgi:hypothetical protein